MIEKLNANTQVRGEKRGNRRRRIKRGRTWKTRTKKKKNKNRKKNEQVGEKEEKLL